MLLIMFSPQRLYWDIFQQIIATKSVETARSNYRLSLYRPKQQTNACEHYQYSTQQDDVIKEVVYLPDPNTFDQVGADGRGTHDLISVKHNKRDGDALYSRIEHKIVTQTLTLFTLSAESDISKDVPRTDACYDRSDISSLKQFQTRLLAPKSSEFVYFCYSLSEYLGHGIVYLVASSPPQSRFRHR